MLAHNIGIKRRIEEARAAEASRREREIAESDASWARVRSAVGAGLAAFGQSMQAAGAKRATAAGCSSDFDCGAGAGCVKSAGSLNGFCAQKVDDFGTPTYAPASVDSIGPGQRQCRFGTDCPIGFSCVSDHCVK